MFERSSRFVYVAIGTVALIGTLTASMQNAIPKYNASGSFEDSGLYAFAGNLGVGTAAPAARLDVTGSVDGLRLSNTDADATTKHVKILARHYSAAEKDVLLMYPVLSADSNRIVYGGGSSAQNAATHHDFMTAENSTTTSGKYRMTITGEGRVGIGTMTPDKTLHVVGDVQVAGNIAAKYQDIAEWVDASEPLPAGTVVVVAPSVVNGVVSSDESYAEGVAGVVSSQPGVLLGEAGPGRVLVAQSGRVRVLVDASFGAIRQGDLLVSSPYPGHAMKSRPVRAGEVLIHRPGTILGKALEPIASGRGKILALLTLQ